MNTGYCIYFGEKPFYIVDNMKEKLFSFTNRGGTIVINQPSPAAIAQSISDLDRTEAEVAIILTNKVDYCWQLFKEHFTFQQAGGGFVQNDAGEYLFIHRRGKWDLPKGKLDDGETIEACAIREVQEETGLTAVHSTAFLCSTYHVYHEKSRFILKESVWYEMKAPGNQVLVPQEAEDIGKAEWRSLANTEDVLSNTYPSIKYVLKKALRKQDGTDSDTNL